MGVSKLSTTVLDYIGVGSIMLDPAVSETVYFKHDARVSLIINFIGDPHVLMQQPSPQRPTLT